jgi:hypothetical protein
MSKKVLTSLDFAKNQILNVALQNLGAPPASPVTGQIYYDTTDFRVYFWDGTSWIDMSGDIRDVVGGAGLTATTVNDIVTLDVNVDNVTIEIDGSDNLRIKDLGVSTAKLADSAVTTIKINNNAVTLGKIQQIGAMKFLANLTGSTANVAEYDVLTDITSGALNTNIATSLAIKTYVDNLVAGIGILQGGWDASSGTFPVASGGTMAGDYWYVTVAGTTGGVTFNVGDVIIAKVNGASTTNAADWIALEVNRDQATETTLGVIKLATQALTNAGVDDLTAVTPLKLAGRTATETRTGIAEIATQAETDAGLDDTTIVTPLKLATYLSTYVGGYKTSVNVTAPGTYTVTHNLNNLDVQVEVYKESSGETVICEVIRTGVNAINVVFAWDASVTGLTGNYRVLVKEQ